MLGAVAMSGPGLASKRSKQQANIRYALCVARQPNVN